MLVVVFMDHTEDSLVSVTVIQQLQLGMILVMLMLVVV